MQSMDRDGKSFEEVVREIIESQDLLTVKVGEQIEDVPSEVRRKAIIQRLRNEMRKYVTRPNIFDKQIKILQQLIERLESGSDNATDFDSLAGDLFA